MSRAERAHESYVDYLKPIIADVPSLREIKLSIDSGLVRICQHQPDHIQVVEGDATMERVDDDEDGMAAREDGIKIQFQAAS
uniref:Uncharacterized protein n=1 Tax=Oryza barthii TaxID=65489 RepID=A0A0D3F9V9_9ORYZ